MAIIDDVTVDLFTYTLDKPMGGSGVSQVDILTVEVRDADGAAGLGFSYVIAGGGGPLRVITEAIVERHVRGQPQQPPAATWRHIAKTFNRTGAGWNLLALAAIDVALWDLHAHQQGIPLGVAMGGAQRPVPVYESGRFQPGMAPEAAAETARAAVATGFRGVKPRVAAMPADVAMIAAVRQALPDDRFLMLDANEKGDLARARYLLDAARANGVSFVEEPVAAADLGAYRHLSANYGALVATGEHLQGAAAFEPYVAGGMAAVLQPDLAMIGGLTPSLDLARVAEFHGLGVAPHFLPSLFVHLAAASPAVRWLESFPLLEPMFDGLPEMNSDGCLAIDPARPGHGLSLSEHARRMRQDG